MQRFSSAQPGGPKGKASGPDLLPQAACLAEAFSPGKDNPGRLFKSRQQQFKISFKERESKHLGKLARRGKEGG